VAHSTEKWSRDGMQDFIGHSTIKQRPDWHVRVRKTDDHEKVLWCHGNDEGEHARAGLVHPKPPASSSAKDRG
jgi:hypothetical protein